MKKYFAQHYKKQFILKTEDHKEIGRIDDESSFFFRRNSIEYKLRTYDIKNVGFLKNDVELYLNKKVIYFTDLAKERIIKSGENVKIYNFKLLETKKLFEKEKLLIEIRTENKNFKNLIYHVEVDDSVEDLLILLFLHYSTKEFNSIGGDGD